LLLHASTGTLIKLHQHSRTAIFPKTDTKTSGFFCKNHSEFLKVKPSYHYFTELMMTPVVADCKARALVGVENGLINWIFKLYVFSVI